MGQHHADIAAKVEMLTPHIEQSGIIENERLQGAIRVPVTLHQERLLVLAPCESHTPNHIERQTLCGDNVFGVYSDTVIL